ncbi:MAG TPA: hypothetical protein VFJ76_07950 [Solirubrobacterales bacterium]|nr:hypothetical protein [Solirubrobacterales bacterium]
MNASDIFFSERIWPCHAGGYWWAVECIDIEAIHGKDGFNESALGTAGFKWSARRKIKRYKRQFLREALTTHNQDPQQGEGK